MYCPKTERALAAELLLDKVKIHIFDRITKKEVGLLNNILDQDIRSTLKENLSILKSAYDDNIFQDRQEHIGMLLELSETLNEPNNDLSHEPNTKSLSTIVGPTPAVRNNIKLTNAQISIFIEANGEPFTIQPVVSRIKRSSSLHKLLFSNMLNIHTTQVMTTLKETVDTFVTKWMTIQLDQVSGAIIQLNESIEQIKHLCHKKLFNSPIKPESMQHLSNNAYKRETLGIVKTVFSAPLKKIKASSEQWDKGELNNALLELRKGLDLLNLTTRKGKSRRS